MEKKRFLILIFFLSICYTYAQIPVLYGTTYGGGKYGNGTVFSYNLSTSKESVLINFDTLNGMGPLGNLAYDTESQQLYSFTYNGGKYNSGTMFSYDPSTGKDSTVITFKDTNGRWPGQGSLTEYNDKFYGMTNGGGLYGFGVLFCYDPLTGRDSTLINFDTTAGKEYGPLGSNLVLYPANGLLYGMTYSGGTNGAGCIFSFNPVTGKDTVVVNLDNDNGAQPQEGTLIYNKSNGLLYGVTSNGGTYNNGVLFSYNPLTGKDSVMINFNVLNGSNPYGGVMLDTLNGLIYGLTNSGGLYSLGILYSLDPVSGKQSVLFNFNDTLGSSPNGNVILGPGGKLFGLANNDLNGNGVIFSYDPVAAKYKVVYTFSYIDGSGPYGSLTLVMNPIITSVEGVTNKKNVVVYPNPFSASTTVLFNETGRHYIELYNITGQKIKTAECDDSSYELQRNELTAGIYFLRTLDQEQQYIATVKLVVE